MSTDELLLHVIDSQGKSLSRPDGSSKKGFMLNVNYRDVMDAINAVVPDLEDGRYRKSIEVARRMMVSVILTRHISEVVKLKRVAYLLNVSSHALIVHYRRQHDLRMEGKTGDDFEYQRGFKVILDMLSFQSEKNKQRIDNLLSTHNK